jgi:hypothetical protein
MMEFNYLNEQKAVTRDPAGRYRIDYSKIPEVIANLAKELLVQEATGDRARASAWFEKYDKMPDDLKSTLSGIRDVPVDIDPIQPFPDRVQ